MRAEPATGGVWAPERRALTVGLVLTVTLVAFESLAVATIAPAIEDDLGAIDLYGWLFSAFFLGSLLGTVAAGQLIDRRGAASAYVTGLALFCCGLLLGGLAPSMLALVVARTVQGIGAGAIPAVGYATIGIAYPEELRPRMFAINSTAWVVPGLAGPSIAGVVASATTWRVVFLGLLPLALGAASLAVPALRALPRSAEASPAAGRLGGAIRVAVGAGLMLAGATSASWLTPVLVVVGLVVAAPAFLRLVPPGTARAAPGVPAAVLARGLLTFAFFGADAYVPLALTETRGTSTTVAGLAVTSATLSWTAAAWVQDRHTLSAGPRRLVTAGLAVLAVGIAGAGLILWDAVPLAVAVAAWGIGGFGTGLAYSPISFAVLRDAPAGRTGEATAGMQLCDVVGVAIGTGVGGAAVAAGDAAGWAPDVGIGIAFAIAGLVAAAGVLVARRIPGPAPIPGPQSP